MYAGRTVGITLCTYAGRVKDSKPIRSCSCPCPAQLAQEVTRLNKQLNSKGVCVQVLSNRGKRALIYVYRPKRLEKDLNHPDTLCFLKQCGYQNGCALDLVQQLQEKLCESQDFPHEIGLFLGYPFEDVQGFIQNRGCNSRGFAGIGRCTPTSVRKSACLKSIAIAVMSIAGNGQKGCPSSGLRSPVKVSIFLERSCSETVRKIAVVYWSGTGNTQQMADAEPPVMGQKMPARNRRFLPPPNFLRIK